METVVVGVDGSEGAQRALQVAAHEAALHGARLRIVSAWDIAPAVFTAGLVSGIDDATLAAIREGAERVAREALAEAERLEPGVPCESHTVEGQAAEVLLDQARSASLVVVGNRGRGGFASLLLGSVSQQVVQHAGCPVLVVREASDRQGAGAPSGETTSQSR